MSKLFNFHGDFQFGFCLQIISPCSYSPVLWKIRLSAAIETLVESDGFAKDSDRSSRQIFLMEQVYAVGRLCGGSYPKCTPSFSHVYSGGRDQCTWQQGKVFCCALRNIQFSNDMFLVSRLQDAAGSVKLWVA